MSAFDWTMVAVSLVGFAINAVLWLRVVRTMNATERAFRMLIEEWSS
jgi:hypothetical protein